MELGTRTLAVAAFWLCAGVTVLSVLYLLTGKPVTPARRRALRPRANALAATFSCLSSCIVTGTIATGWTATHPAATIQIAGPAVAASLVLSLFFLARSRRPTP